MLTSSPFRRTTTTSGGARPQLDGEIPDDIIEMIVKRAIHSPHPDEEGWQWTAIPGRAA